MTRNGETPISGQVARILNATDLVINRGDADGVALDSNYVVLNRNGSDIKDPETGAIIGSVPVGKTIVKIVSVQEHMAIARTFRSREVGGNLANISAAALGSIFAPPSVRHETLKTNEARAAQELEEEDSFVKTGDEVIEVMDGDEYLLSEY